MTAEIESLILEHLRHIRAKVDRIGDDTEMLKRRLSTLEVRVARGFGDLETGVAEIHARMDRFDTRLDRIERRLDLTENDT